MFDIERDVTAEIFGDFVVLGESARSTRTTRTWRRSWRRRRWKTL